MPKHYRALLRHMQSGIHPYGINANHYEVKEGFLSVDDDADNAVIKQLAREWEELDGPPPAPAPASAPVVEKTPAGFIRALNADSVLAATIARTKSKAVLASTLAGAGWPAFPPDVLAAAEAASDQPTTDVAARALKALGAGTPRKPKEPGAPAPSTPAVKTYAIPAEGEDWPDPDEAMPRDYLVAMASAYEVPYDEKTTVAELVAALNKAMFA